MFKHKAELLLVVILLPILAYVGWQAYKTYFKPPEIDIGSLGKPAPIIQAGREQKPPSPTPLPPIGRGEKNISSPLRGEDKGEGNSLSAEQKQPVVQEPVIKAPETKGTLGYSGYTGRDPLKHSLPIKEKTEKTLEIKGEQEKTQEPPKEIILPTFTVIGIVWGNVSPMAIIDNETHKVGDIVKGATILDISEKGIRMIYQGKEFWVTMK